MKYLEMISVKKTLLLMILMMAWMMSAVAQIADGMYYIKVTTKVNGNSNGEVYLWRAITEKTDGQPYLSGWNSTSYTDPDTYNPAYSFGPAHCTWIIKQVTVGGNIYYKLINLGTNQYVVWDSYGSGTARAIHLETRSTEPTTTGDHCFFSYETVDGYHYFHPDQCTTSNRGMNYKGDFNTGSDHLRVRDNAGRGLIQFYDGTKNNVTPATLLTAPTISLDPTTSTVTVTDVNDLPDGYNIRYTISNDLNSPPTDPSVSSQIMPNGTLQVTLPCILKAVVERYDVVLTNVATRTLILSPTISFDNAEQQITLQHPDYPDNVTLYYTMGANPADPNPNDPTQQYSGPISYTENTPITVKAIAVLNNNTTSSVTTFDIVRSDEPTITPNPITLTVTIEAAEDADIYYTTTPDADPTTPYSVPLSLDAGTTLRAKAIEEGKLPSEVVETVIAYICPPPEITVNYVTDRVTITNIIPSAYFRYTTDGSDPNGESPLYTGPFAVTGAAGTRIVKAKAYLTGFGPSNIVSLEVEKLEPPTIAPDGECGDHITITSTVEGASIYYTYDGATPNTASYLYTAPLDWFYSGRPIQAIASTNTAIDSDPASGSFTLKCPQPEIFPDITTNLVSLFCDAVDAILYYTLVANPTSSDWIQYTGTPFSLPSSGTIQAYATRPGSCASDIAQFTVNLADMPTIQADNATHPKYITMSTTTLGASIYYTLDGSRPDPENNATHTFRYTGPFRVGPNGERVSDVTIKAIAVKEDMFWSDVADEKVKLECEAPRIVHTGSSQYTFYCDFPSEGAIMYYTTDGYDASSSSTLYSGPVTVSNSSVSFHAIATPDQDDHYLPSEQSIKTYFFGEGISLQGDGEEDDPYLIESDYEYGEFVVMANGEYSSACYRLVADVSAASAGIVNQTFTGLFEGSADEEGNFYTISGLTHPMFKKIDAEVTDGSIPTDKGIVRNVILKEVNISGFEGNTGAIAGEITRGACIYNCGVLSGSIGGTGNVGGIVGLLEKTSFNNTTKPYNFTRVINCFSFANITSKGADGSGDNQCWAAGVVGNNSYESKVDGYPFDGEHDCKLKTAVINCMFYGDITAEGTNIAPVFGNKYMSNLNEKDKAINRYDYFKDGASFVRRFDQIEDYRATWPAEEKYLTQFEYYRSILNSNRLLCTAYVTGKQGDNLYSDTALIAKWVRDESIAPYPILKKWGKYPSIINPDTERVWDNKTHQWVSRDAALDYQGKSFGTLNVTVKTGDHPGDEGMTGIDVINDKSWSLTITDMDTLNYDYGYYKVQLPYYNEVFGDPSETDHIKRYYGNYTDKVVTGWKITAVSGGTPGEFVPDWQNGYNFADRYCTQKDLYSVSGRVFAQGGFYYVPEGVTSIEIEAYWGKAVYLRNKDQYIDRVSVTNPNNGADYGFAPAGSLSATFQGQTVYDTWQNAIQALDESTDESELTVYDQAIVLVGNLQVLNKNQAVGSNLDHKTHPYTLMSADFDLDNEPDYCFQLQFRQGLDRWPIQPIRFDFLAIPELGMAVRHNQYAYSIGIFVPEGHFEITETAFMHLTQFEYEGIRYKEGENTINTNKTEAPVILNGGQFEQIVVRYAPNSIADKTLYFIMGGHFRMKRFTPGSHVSATAKVRLCAVNCIGGEYPELYLSGIYRPDIVPGNNQGNPHCYTNGGKFGTICGSGYEKILGDVTFKIDHSVIGEFYGGGIDATNPVGGHIDVTIDHSIVRKYCGGPKVGAMVTGKTVTTRATGTTFGQFYGGGNGGTNYYRDMAVDGNDWLMPTGDFTAWEQLHKGSNSTNVYDPNDPNKGFNPLNTRTGKNTQYDPNKGYHDVFEFEVFNNSNGLPLTDNEGRPTIRTYVHWAQFGITQTGAVTNTLTDCKVLQDFYGGGNLGIVNGNVTSTLEGETRIYGSAYGGGYSAAIPKIRYYDIDRAVLPYVDFAGVMHNGELETEEIPYKQANGEDIYYEWIHNLPAGVSGVDTDNPLFEYQGKHYCYTKEEFTDLGVVKGNTILNVNGNTKIYGRGPSEVDPEVEDYAGAAFGGGNESDVIGNSTVTVSGTSGLLLSNIYGGGNTAVTHGDSWAEVRKGTIGVRGSDGKPLSGSGTVYGGGKGDLSDEKLGGVLRNSTVVISGGLVMRSVYGGGELGSVGTFTEYDDVEYLDENNQVVETVRVPKTCETGTGLTTVLLSGGQVGIKETLMPVPGTPAEDDDFGYVFCAGRGEADSITYPKAIAFAVSNDSYCEMSGTTLVTASVYGGSENGLVLGNTHVRMTGGQIGVGYYKVGNEDHWDDRYTDDQWNDAIQAVRAVAQGGSLDDYDNPFHECDAWPYEYPFYTYDIYADEYNTYDGAVSATDGNSFYGNLYGGGSGFYPIAPGVWRRSAGVVKGNTLVEITDGHILTSIYGGNEFTSVGGKCTVNMSGGTLGVPRTAEQVATHPVTCYLFGGGLGDPRADFDDYNNVSETEVNVTGGTIFGSVFGGAENGHVIGNAVMNISEAARPTLIGSTGLSGADGNLFGGGRGFTYNDVTNGRVGGNTTINVTGGTMLGCIFGGGRIGSVGMDEDGGMTGTGVSTINISGGTLGVDHRDDVNSGHVFGGCKGIYYDASTGAMPFEWQSLGAVRQTEVSVSGSARIYGSVYGGGQVGSVAGNATVTIEGGTIGSASTDGNPGDAGYYHFGSVYGGGKGYYGLWDEFTLEAGAVFGNASVTMSGGKVMNNVFGGGEKGSVGTYTYTYTYSPYGYEEDIINCERVSGGNTSVTVSGGELGPLDMTGVNAYVFGGGKGIGNDNQNKYKCFGQVYATHVQIQPGARIYGSVFGGGEDGHVLDAALVDVTGGTLGTAGLTTWDGNIFGGGRNYSKAHRATGRVGKDIHINVSGNAFLYGNIYGGGRMGSVGVDLNGNVLTDGTRGNTYIDISGGTIGNPSSTSPIVGNVYGGAMGADDYETFALVRNSDIHIHGNAYVTGSVFGGGFDGQIGGLSLPVIDDEGTVDNLDVEGSTNVLISGGNVGTSGVSTPYKGYAYGGGRGYDIDPDDPDQGQSLGRVNGDTRITVKGGDVWQFVFGGGNQSLVMGRKRVNIAGGWVHQDVYGGSNAIPSHAGWLQLHPGLKTVNIMGGKLNNVYGCSRSTLDGELLENNQPKDDVTAFVNISGGELTGSVHGAGKSGLVYGSVMVYIGENAIYNAPYNSEVVDNATVLKNVDRDDYNNVIGGTGRAHHATRLLISGSVYGGSEYYESEINPGSWNDYNITAYSNIYVDGKHYNMNALTTNPVTFENLAEKAMLISGDLYGSGVSCESGRKGRTITVRNYGLRVNNDDGWFLNSTRFMATIQRCDNLVIDSSNFSFTGKHFLGDASSPLYSVAKVDSCLYVANASGISLGYGDGSANMDSIRMVRSVHLNRSTDSVYMQKFPRKLNWDWVGIRDTEKYANNLYYVHNNTVGDQVPPIGYTKENVLVFNNDSRLYVRYQKKDLENGNLVWKGNHYGELNGFFRMIAPKFLPWGNDSFAFARPKLTVNNGGVSQGETQVNDSDGGFLSYQRKYNFFIQNTASNDGNDGGTAHTQTYQYPYTNVMELGQRGDMEEYRMWVVPEFKGKRWYVDGTRGWGKDLMGDGTNAWTYDWGTYPDKPKASISGTGGIFDGTKHWNSLPPGEETIPFHYVDNIVYYDSDVWNTEHTEILHHQGDVNEEASTYKDVVYVVGPIDALKENLNGLLNPEAATEGATLMLYRYPGGHPLSTTFDPENPVSDATVSEFHEADGNTYPVSTTYPRQTDPNYHGLTGSSDEGPGANYGAMVVVSENQQLTMDNVLVDGLFGHVGIDATYMDIPDNYSQRKVMRPLVVTESGSTLTMKGGLVLKRGGNNIEAARAAATGITAGYYYNPDFNLDGSDATLHGGALYVHPSATVNVQGLAIITKNKQRLSTTVTTNDQGQTEYSYTDIESNVFLPTFATHLHLTDAVSDATRVGVTNPTRNAETGHSPNDYQYNTFSPVAEAAKSGATDEQNSAIALAAWRNNNFYDDLDWFFCNAEHFENGTFQGHSAYYENTIHCYPNDSYPMGLNPAKTLFHGWTWANVVRSAPASGYAESGNTITVSSKEGLAWLISKVNGMNGQTGNVLQNGQISLTTDVDLEQYVWVPIGSDQATSKEFGGQFDGRGHLIKHMNIHYIGLGDQRYEMNNFGLFGTVQGAQLNRTFVVDSYIHPANRCNVGGLVGWAEGVSVNNQTVLPLIENSEAAVEILQRQSIESNGIGGLAGHFLIGNIRNSMAMPVITATKGYLGGLVGYAGDLENNQTLTGARKIENSFALINFDVHNEGNVENNVVAAGGLIGSNKTFNMQNCYVRWIGSASGHGLTDGNFGTLTHSNSGTVTKCYDWENSFTHNSSSNAYTNCYSYTSVIDANKLGYMYSDNVVTVSGQKEALFKILNRWVDGNNGNNTTYANWSRPALGEINGDYPVLLLCDNDETNAHQGSFRSMGTYAGGRALQYGGPVRDGGEVSVALARPLEEDENGDDIPDYLFIYGDVNTVGSPTITQSKVSIYEHAAILDPGVLGVSGGSSKVGEYDNTYVGVSFDNSCGGAMSSPGINVGLVTVGGHNLPRDWHMFSTPLSNAPLGFNYEDQNQPISGHDSFDSDPHYDADGFYCNPWKTDVTNPNNASNYLEHEFEWLTAPGSAECTDRSGQGCHDNRYWMGTGVDGYFPYYRGSLFSDPDNPNLPLKSEVENLFITNSTSSVNEYYVDGDVKVNRYPYGMDFYSWYEPMYHWINFKRNGPNHWHSDEPHDHLDYTPETSTNWTPSQNVNETTLLSGKGYMAAIAKETLLQSHGTLNNGTQSISLTRSGTYFTGWNLVGNPYHAYLDFDALAASNTSLLASGQTSSGAKEGESGNVPFYAIYDADGYGHDNYAYPTTAAESAYRYYVVGGSPEGEYASKYLHPHQGFFVLTPEGSAKSGGGTLTFTTDMIVPRDELGEDDGLFLKGRPSYPLVNLYLTSDNGCRDVTVIEFNRPDWGGARKMKELRQGNGIVYGYYNETDYAALFVKKGANRVPVRFEPNEDDFFTLHWNHANGEFTSMFLVDNMTGEQTDMLAYDSYTFEAHKYDYKSRFYIVFSLAEDYEEDEHSFVFFDGSQWVVMGEGELDVIDVLGHVLMHARCTDGLTRLNLSNVACGVYLVRLTQGKECKVQKIIVQP